MKVLLSLCLIVFCVAASYPTTAQVADTLRPDPNVRPLRKIWVKEGERANALFGDGFAGFGDIYGLGRGAWGISNADPPEWRIYTWDTTADTARMMQSFYWFGTSPRTPAVGDFYGTGHNVVGLPRAYIDTTVHLINYQIYFFRSDANRIDTVPSLILNTLDRQRSTWTEPTLLRSIDLDGDGADDLIMYVAGAVRHDSLSRKPEVWIYKGGPNFQVDTPTVILHDTEPNGGRSYFSLYVGDFDGDHRPDIVTCSDYYDALGLQKLKFYFSHNGSPWNWTEPEHEVLLKDLSRPIPVALDCTGDSVLDLAMARTARVDLYRSNVGRDIHTRSFDSTDADNVYLSSGLIFPDRFGYLNDSSRRYEMLDIVAGSDLGLSGAPAGPDAHYKTINGDILARAASVGDVTGDGWDDLLSASPGYDFGTGVVNLFAGGPYIPRDPAMGVRTLATIERPDALHVWPNPIQGELHIAWRGDLVHQPRRFVVHDILGREITHGSVASWDGEIVWHAEGYPAGVYLVSLVAADGSLIATVSTVKE
jgi:hypothetical protein